MINDHVDRFDFNPNLTRSLTDCRSVYAGDDPHLNIIGIEVVRRWRGKRFCHIDDRFYSGSRFHGGVKLILIDNRLDADDVVVVASVVGWVYCCPRSMSRLTFEPLRWRGGGKTVRWQQTIDQ